MHASLDHLKALIQMAEQEEVPKINLHLFSDAKDSPPHTVETFLKEIPTQYLASLIGRYYGMDRSGNWQLTEEAYRTMTGTVRSRGQQTPAKPSPQPTHRDQPKNTSRRYASPKTKRYRMAIRVFFFNYREDSIRQIASSFIIKPFDKFPTVDFKNLLVATMSHYDDSFTFPSLSRRTP